jgi:hypothetical protein
MEIAAVASAVSGPLQKLVDVIVNPLIRLMFIIAFLVFLWGMVEFIRTADNESGRDKGKQHMLWGVVGMAIMVSATGIISILQGTIESIK